jgi:CrcB protein
MKDQAACPYVRQRAAGGKTGYFAVTLQGNGGGDMGYAIIFVGGGLGAALRHGINLGAARWLGAGFPYATLIVNVSGSLIMGLIAGYFAFKGDASQNWRLFLTTGILGGYTTFSTFSLDAALLYQRGEVSLAAIYVLASVVLSIAGLFAGLWLARSF